MRMRVLAPLACMLGALLVPAGAQGQGIGREANPSTPRATGTPDSRAGAAAQYCTLEGHFCVTYATAGSDAPDPADADNDGVPDYVETVGTELELAYAKEVTQLGWTGTPPVPVPTTQVYLTDFAGTQYGQASSGRLDLDNDYDLDEVQALGSTGTSAQARRATIAHEFNHVLQFRYGGGGSAAQWQLESVATWMEDQVFPDANDYVHFVNGWATCPEIPLTTATGSRPKSDPCRRKVYGAAEFNHWLSQNYGPAVVRDGFAKLSAAGGFAPRAYGMALGASYDGGIAAFRTAFAEFATASAEWKASDSVFPDHGLIDFPDVRRDAPALAVGGADRSVTLDHTAYTLLPVPASGAPPVRLHARLPDGVSGAVALVGRTPAGTTITEPRELPNGGPGDVTLDNPASFDRITAVLVNTDVDRSGNTWLGDGQPFCNVRVTTTASATDPACGAPAGAASSSSGGTGASTGTGRATPAAIPALAYRLAASSRQKRSSVLKRGVAFTLRCNRACTARANLTLSRRTAKRLGLSRTVGAANTKLTKAGANAVFVRLSRRARAKLRRQKRVTLTLTLRTRASSGGTKATARRVTIVR